MFKWREQLTHSPGPATRHHLDSNAGRPNIGPISGLHGWQANARPTPATVRAGAATASEIWDHFRLGLWSGIEYLHFLDYKIKFNIICWTYHAQFTQWFFEGTYWTSCIYILQDVIPITNTNILKRFLATHCSINWNVQLVRGCITCIMIMDICNFYKHIFK